jgi:hypothetical protein
VRLLREEENDVVAPMPNNSRIESTFRSNPRR